MQMISGDKMTELTLELQILAYTDVKRVQPFTRMAFTNRSIFLLDQRSLCTLYMDSGKTKNPPRVIQKFLDESLLITLSDNGCFLGGITTDGNIFLWDKDNNIHRIVNGMPMLASSHYKRFLSDAGLSLPYLCIGDTGFHLLVINSNFQLFLWEASDINRNYWAYGPDEKLLEKANSKGILTGSWSLISQPPEIKLPSFGDHEACIHSVFVQNNSTWGFHCLCSVVFYDSNSELLVSTLMILFGDRRSSLSGAPKFEAIWKPQSHSPTSILPAGRSREASESIKETGALLIKHSKDGQIIAVSLNRASPQSHIVFLSPNHSLFLGRADIKSHASAGSINRHHWVVSMEWTPDDLFLVCLTGLGCAHLVARLGSTVMCLVKDFDFNSSPMGCLPLHPLVSFSGDSMVTSSPANCMPQQFSLAVHPNCPVFLCSDGYSVSAVQIMSKHTCLSLMQEISKSTSSFFRLVEKKFSTRVGRKEGLLNDFKDRRLLGISIPCEPPLRPEVRDVFKFETTPAGLQGDANLPPFVIDAKSRSVNFPDSGKVEFAGIHVEMSGDVVKEQSTLNDYLNQLEDRCIFGWTLASSHAGLWTLEHEMVMQGIVENLVKTMHLMIVHGGALVIPTDRAPSSSPISSRGQPLISPDRKFNPGLMRAIALLEKLLKILKLNCNNVDEQKGKNKNASAGSLINCSLLLVHWLVQAVLAGPSKRSKVHALNGCYKIIETTEKNLMEMFLSSSNLFTTKIVKAEPCLVFSSNQSDSIEEEEGEENETNSIARAPTDGGRRDTEQISEEQVSETTNRNLSESAIEESILPRKKSYLGRMASLAQKKKGGDSMDAIIFRRMSSVLPSTAAPPVSIVSRNTLACIRSRLCASYRLLYRHACRHLERVANECQDRDPEAIRKQLVGTKRIASLLICKMEEMRSHLVPYCVDNFKAKAERRFLDHEQTSAIYTWLNELLELKDGASPSRACRLFHSILYTYLSRYDAFGAIQLVEKVVRIANVKQICFGSDFSRDKDGSKENNANSERKSRNTEKRKQLENLQKDVLSLFWSARALPLSVGISDDTQSSIQSAIQPMKLFLNLPSKRLFQTMGRFMARYFVWGCEPFVHPPHQPYSLSPLYENPETVDEERRLVPIQRVLLTKAINMQQFGKAWSPVRALQYLLLSGLFPDAVWYLHNLGNARAAVSVAAVVEHRRSVVKSERNLFKLSFPPCFQTHALLKDMVVELIKGSLKSDSWIEDSSQLQSNFTSVFLASAVCKVDVLTPVVKMMIRAMLGLIINQQSGECARVLELLGVNGNADRRHFFSHPLVSADIKSPLPSVYFPQPSISSADESRLSQTYLRELRARILLQRIFSLVQIVFSAAGCLKILVSSYSRVVLETFSKVGLQRSTPSELLKPYSEASERSDAGFSDSALLSDFRDLCSLMWLMTLRDRLFLAFKGKQKEEHEQMRRPNTAKDLDWLAVCRDCVQSCMKMLPFSDLLGCASQLNSLLLSSLFELPDDEETASTTARCFPRPEALDPDCRSRLQLKLKEWETAFVSSGSNRGDGSTMAAYYFKHCNSNVSQESGGSSSEQIAFPNLIVHEGDSTFRRMTGHENEGIVGTNEKARPVLEAGFKPRSFEVKEDYVRFLVDFFEVLTSNNKKIASFPPLVPGNFKKIRSIEFRLLDDKPNMDWLTYQDDDDSNYNSKKSQRGIPTNTQAPLSGLLNTLGGRNSRKLENEDQQKLLNVAKLIGNRPSKQLNVNNNSNNDGNITGNVNYNNNNDEYDDDGVDVTENTGVISNSFQASDNIVANNNTKTRGILSEFQTNGPSIENPIKSTVDFSNKPYLHEEPGNEIRFTSHCIHPSIFESMNFGSSYQETERLARWLCKWSDSDATLDKRTREKGPSPTGREDGSPSAAIKVPLQPKFLVYGAWSAERQEIYERIRTEVDTIPVEVQVFEEELEEEMRKVLKDDSEIRDVSTQSDDVPRIRKQREMTDNFNQMFDTKEEDYSQELLDGETQTEPIRNAETKPTTLDVIQVAVKEEMKRIIEAQNHGILSVLEHLKSSSFEHQQELRDLLQVLQVPLQQPTALQAPAQIPSAYGANGQYDVYTLTVETKNDEGFSGSCSKLKDVPTELDHFRMMADCKPKNLVDSSDIIFSRKSIDDQLIKSDHKVMKIEKDSEIKIINISSNPDNKGKNNNIGCNQVKNNASLQSKLPKIVDVISELKVLISSQKPELGKLLRLPANATNSMLNKSEQELKFSKLISALKSIHLDSFNGRYPIHEVSNQFFSANFRFPTKLPQDKIDSNNNNNNLTNNSNNNNNLTNNSNNNNNLTNNSNNNNNLTNNNNNNNNLTNNNSIDHNKRKGLNKAHQKEPCTPTTKPGLSQNLPLLKMQPHQQKKHLALIKASQATQKQLLHLQERQLATQIHEPHRTVEQKSQLQGRMERPCRQRDRVHQRSDADILPCPCLPSPDDHIYDSIRKLIHRQVQEHEKRKQFEQLQEQTTLKVREKKSSDSTRPSTVPLIKREMEESDFARLSTSSLPKTPPVSSAKKKDFPCPTLEILRDEQQSTTQRSPWGRPIELGLPEMVEPFDVRPPRDHSSVHPADLFSRPTNAQLQLLAATGVAAPCCPKFSPQTVPRTNAEDAKMQLERCQEKLEEAKEEIMMLKNALNQELQRLDSQKDEAIIASQVLNPESALVEPDELDKADRYESVMEPLIEKVVATKPVETTWFEDSLAENLLDEAPPFPITMVRENCPEYDVFVEDDCVEDVARDAKAPNTAMNEIFFSPTLISSRPQDLRTLRTDNIDLKNTVVMETNEAARHESIFTPTVVSRGRQDLRVVDMERPRKISLGVAPHDEYNPVQAIHVIRLQEEIGANLILEPDLQPQQHRRDEIMFSPQFAVKSPPVTFRNREDMSQFCNGTNFHNNLNNDSNNHDNDKSGNDDKGHDERVPISPRCLRSLRFGFHAVMDMDANVKAIQEMASNIEKDFKSTRLINKGPKITPCDKQLPATPRKAMTVATCSETPSCTAVPHFFINKNLGHLNKMVDCSIPRDERNNPISTDCQQRSASPQTEAHVGWMSDAQRSREDEKKRRLLKNMGERCKMAEDLIKGLIEGADFLNKSQSANPRVERRSSVPIPAYHYDRTNWMNKTELKPHPRSTYVERLQKATNQPKNHWVFYKCQSKSDRFKTMKGNNRQVRLKGERYDFMNPLTSKAKKPIGVEKCGTSKTFNVNNNTTSQASSRSQKAVNFEDNVGQLHDGTIQQSEDSLELGADYLDMVAVDDLKSVDSSMISEIDWSQVDRIVGEEDATA